MTAAETAAAGIDDAHGVAADAVPQGVPAAIVESISVQFPGSAELALSDVTVRCDPGEFVVLVGRSGSGKTTILNVLSGLVKPEAGRVEVLGRGAVEARRDVGFMFARDALMQWRTAQRNVELGLEIRGVPRAERRHRAAEMLERVGLAHAAGRLPWQLSQGMRQRVALARTWVAHPPLLLMDEPFSALDAQTRRELQDEFLHVWQGSGASVVLVTHDLTEALLLADRVVLLSHGQVVEDVVVPFARPRSLDDLVVSLEFRELERRLWELLR